MTWRASVGGSNASDVQLRASDYFSVRMKHGDTCRVRSECRSKPLSSADPLVRLLSACTGSTAVALIVTPLDVARVRMQAVGNTGFGLSCGIVQCVSSSCGSHFFDPPLWKCFPCEATPVPGMLKTLRSTFAEGGFAGLYAGLPATLLMGIPSNVLYFASYEALRDWMQRRELEASAPFVAGGAARAVSVTACSPLEVLRTRIQARLEQGPRARGSGSMLARMVREEGPAVLIRGLTSTLWRDVPFSALYWFGTESMRDALMQRGCCEGSSVQFPVLTLVSSATSGGVAAFITTPFDVVKTRSQLDCMPASRKHGCRGTAGRAALGIWQTMALILREEGFRGLWTGTTPRIARVAPACGIMLGTYEMMKYTVRLW